MGGDEGAFGEEVSRGRAFRNETIGGQKRKPSRMAKRLLLGFVGLLFLFALSGAYLTHGFLWSVYVPIYRQLLDSIPTPPGLLPESLDTTLEAYHPCGGRSYEVNNEYEATLAFFITEVPRAGWELVAQRSQTYLDKMIFVNRQRYWLEIEVYPDTSAEGVQFVNSLVFLTVCRDAEQIYVFDLPATTIP